MAPQKPDVETSSQKTVTPKLLAQDAGADGQNRANPVAISGQPDGGYGWVVVAAVFLINMHSWGLNSSYGVFLAHFVNNDTYPGGRILDFSFIAGLSISTALFLAPIATFCVSKFGTNVTLLLGTFFETLSMITSSFTTEIWQLYLSQGICFGVGLGFLYTASIPLIPQWFSKKRSFASAIGTAGSGLGGLVYNLASQAVIQRAGFRWAYRMIGLCAFAVTFVCAILARDRNKAIGANLRLYDSGMLKRMEFDFVQLWGWFSMFGYLVLVYSLPEYSTSIGLTASQGSICGAILNLGQAVGRPLVGFFSDRVGRINVATGLTFLCGFYCLVWWTLAKSFSVLVAFAFFVGTVSGTYWAAIAPVGAEVVGLKDLPCALSMTWVILVPPTTFSEVIALEIESHTGYLYAQIYTGLCYIVAGFCLWVVRVWKIGQLEQLAAREGIPIEKVTSVQAETPAEEGIDLSIFPKSSVIRRALKWTKV